VSGFLLDTNVVSELRKRDRANARLRAWFETTREDAMFLSVLVLGEIRRGVERLRKRDVSSARALDRWIARLERGHADRILPVDQRIADEWGRLDAAHGLPAIDGLLAATASVHDLVLVTRNARDVARSGVAVLDPFADRTR
jgi:predicted nucleic acid-binding protein